MEKLPLFLRMMRRRARQGPPARYDVRWERALAVPGPAGDLLTDHYAPVTTDPCPTVLIRSPYIRGGFPWNWLYGLLLAEQGCHVLLQSSRGTGGSAGEFHFWRNEAPDGQATVEWIRKQEWFGGELFTVGPSYCAYTQWALGLDPPPEWRGAAMQVGLGDPHDFFWGGGAFGLERALVGGLGLFNGQSMTVGQNIRAILRLQLNLKRAITRVPLFDAYPAAFGGRRPAFEEWLDHPEQQFWAGSTTMPVADTLDVPVSLCTGWWDLATTQVIEQYQRMAAAGRDVDLLIGPWTHTSSLRDGWPEIFPQTMRRLRREQPTFAVRVHVGGLDEWRNLPSWPPPDTHPETWHLTPAATGTTPLHAPTPPGAASPAPAPPGAAPPTPTPPAPAGSTAQEPARRLLFSDISEMSPTWSFRYDPTDPTPSIGGPLQSPTQGQRDNAPLERRTDVITFTGPALDAPVQVMGPVRAEFEASTTAASGDLFARLCDVAPDGRSINICDGLTRMSGAGRIVVELGHTAHVFRPGHRLRLLVAGGAHPRYLRNYGTGEPPGRATRMVPTTTTIRDGSMLTLTVV